MLTWTAIKMFFGGAVGKIVLIGGAVAAFVGWLALNNWKQRRKGRDEERKERLEDHVEAIEQGREAEADTGDSPRAKRLRDEFRRD